MRISTIERLAKNITCLTGIAAIEATTNLRDRLVVALERSKVLGDFIASEQIDMAAPGSPVIHLKYLRVISPFYATELSFSVDNAVVRAYASTLHFTDGAGAASTAAKIAGNGAYHDEVQFYSIEGLAKTAVQRGLEQRVTLVQDLGFIVSRPTQKKLLKTSGCMAL